MHKTAIAAEPRPGWGLSILRAGDWTEDVKAPGRKFRKINGSCSLARCAHVIRLACGFFLRGRSVRVPVAVGPILQSSSLSFQCLGSCRPSVPDGGIVGALRVFAIPVRQHPQRARFRNSAVGDQMAQYRSYCSRHRRGPADGPADRFRYGRTQNRRVPKARDRYASLFQRAGRAANPLGPARASGDRLRAARWRRYLGVPARDVGNHGHFKRAAFVSALRRASGKGCSPDSVLPSGLGGCSRVN
jgi:hypothetical protein